MKKSLIALAALAATGAFAQSSVTIWGVVDIGLQRASVNSVSKTQLTASGLSSGQLGFRGVEDLGGGMSAGFWLEGTIAGDSGTGSASGNGNGSTGGGLAFGRRATVELAGSFGAIRLGREYTPTFWNHTVFDPFGTLGSGAGTNITQLGQNNLTGARSNNSISYLYGFNPNSTSNVGKGGLYVQAMYAPGEKASTAAANTGTYSGARVGYNAGPLNVAVATASITSGAGLKDKETNIGAAYNVGFANLMAKYGTAECKVGGGADSCGGIATAAKYTWWSLGATIPMGAGYIPVSYNSGKNNVNAAKGTQLAVGYVHNLSKRTAVYTTYSRINNSNGGVYTYLGGNAGFNAGLAAAGGDGNAFDLGIRHSF